MPSANDDDGVSGAIVTSVSKGLDDWESGTESVGESTATAGPANGAWHETQDGEPSGEWPPQCRHCMSRGTRSGLGDAPEMLAHYVANVPGPAMQHNRRMGCDTA